MPRAVIAFHDDVSCFDPAQISRQLRTALLPGALTLRGTGVARVSFVRGVSEPFEVSHFNASFAGAFWRRTVSAIRQGSSDFLFVRLIEKGELSATTSHGTCKASEGDFSISRASIPYFAELLPDAHGVHEAYHACVPAYLLGSEILSRLDTALPIPGRDGAGRIARETLKLLFLHGEQGSALVRASLGESFISAFIQAVTEAQHMVVYERPGDRHLAEILRFVDTHAANPQLSVEAVARGCGISRRYLSALMRRQALTLTHRLCQRRLEIARGILASPAMSELAIGKIATMSGFISAQYFCRMFKKSYGISPGTFRRNLRNEMESSGST